MLKEKRTTTHFSVKKFILWFLGMLFLGLMVSTAGIAIFPTLGKIAAPFITSILYPGGKFIVASENISAEYFRVHPGTGVVITRGFYCVDKSGTVRNVNFLTFAVATVGYSLLFYAVWFVGVLAMAVKRKLSSHSG